MIPFPGPGSVVRTMDLPKLEFPYLRDQIVGVDASFETAFGHRMMIYCDYTASGRTLNFVEE